MVYKVLTFLSHGILSFLLGEKKKSHIMIFYSKIHVKEFKKNQTMLFAHETNLLQRKQFLKDPVVIYFEKGRFHLRDGVTDSQIKQTFL